MFSLSACRFSLEIVGTQRSTRSLRRFSSLENFSNFLFRLDAYDDAEIQVP